MKTYLEKENNEYTRYILQKLQNPKSNRAKSFNGEKTQIHHIIPKHAGGKNNYFNRILLTVSEHQMAHAIRYSVYKEFGDYNVSYMNKLTGTELVPFSDEYEKQLEEQRKRGSETQKQKQIGIFSLGAAKRAGQISGQQPPTLTKKLGSAKNRTEKTRNLLNITGSKWTHVETGIKVTVEPSPYTEMRNIKDALAAALPSGHPDRLKLESSTGKAGTTQINNIAKFINGAKGRGNSVYGFVFEPLK